jgi:hypothetical protein
MTALSMRAPESDLHGRSITLRHCSITIVPLQWNVSRISITLQCLLCSSPPAEHAPNADALWLWRVSPFEAHGFEDLARRLQDID